MMKEGVNAGRIPIEVPKISDEKDKSIAYYEVEGELDAHSFSHAMWNNESMRSSTTHNGMNTAVEMTTTCGAWCIWFAMQQSA